MSSSVRVQQSHRPLDPGTRRVALSVARALLPSGSRFPDVDERTIAAAERLLAGWGGGVPTAWGRAVRALEHAPRAVYGRPFSALEPGEATALLDRWGDAGNVRRALTLAVTAPLKLAYFDNPSIYADLRCEWRHEQDVKPERWRSQIIDGDQLEDDTVVDAVVIGTGAGGAVVARELAERGHAVLLLETGAYHTREEFTGASMESLQRFYLRGGAVASIGNCVIPIMAGQMVGGSTAVNSGTCFRAPDRVLERWARNGLPAMAPDRVGPYFDRVEDVLQVTPADMKQVGGVGRIVARGADRLGWSHGPLNRNAPDCDGQGLCQFGCPTGAKRSTDVSYIPLALQSGAVCATGVRAETIVMDGDRAAGVVAVTRSRKRIRVRARITVVAGGSLLTPVLLMKQPFAASLPQLGRNLSIHPAVNVAARFDEQIDAHKSIPQGYAVDEFHREGVLLEGGTVPIDMGALQFNLVGRELMEIMEHYDECANFAAMVIDRSIGRVRPGRDGRPIVTYWMGRQEKERARRGVEAIARLFLAAGARAVYPMIRGHRVLRSESDVDRLREERLRARDFFWSAYHPLGTARMAMHPKQGVVGPDHEVFGVRDLYVADGSVMPSCTEVNPQVSIMALATRAADIIADRLETGDRMSVKDLALAGV